MSVAAAPSRIAPFLVVMGLDLQSDDIVPEISFGGPWPSRCSDSGSSMLPVTWRNGCWHLPVILPASTSSVEVILLLALLEHVSVGSEEVRYLLVDAILGSLPRADCRDRTRLVPILIARVNRALDFLNGGPNLSSTLPLVFDHVDRRMGSRRGRELIKSIWGYGGEYRLVLQLRDRGRSYQRTQGRELRRPSSSPASAALVVH